MRSIDSSIFTKTKQKKICSIIHNIVFQTAVQPAVTVCVANKPFVIFDSDRRGFTFVTTKSRKGKINAGTERTKRGWLSGQCRDRSISSITGSRDENGTATEIHSRNEEESRGPRCQRTMRRYPLYGGRGSTTDQLYQDLWQFSDLFRNHIATHATFFIDPKEHTKFSRYISMKVSNVASMESLTAVNFRKQQIISLLSVGPHEKLYFIMLLLLSY